MKNKIKMVSLSLCAAMLLSVPVLAAETPPAPDAAPITAPAPAAPVCVSGKVTKQEDGSLLLKNDSQEDPNQEIIVHLPEGVPFVDGAAGTPLDIKTVKDGDTLSIWLGPAMTMSLPPQASAIAVVGNVPAGSAGPQYAEITAPAKVSEGSTERVLPIAGGELTVPGTAQITPYLTKKLVTLDDLVPGAQILVWPDKDGKAERILLFPYAYAGYMAANESGAVHLDGEELKVKGRVIQNDDLTQLYLPLRAAAEAAGYEVDWVSGKGAVVSESGTELFSVLPGSDTAQTSDGGHGLLGGCIVDGGVTYLPAGDMADLLNLYYYTA